MWSFNKLRKRKNLQEPNEVVSLNIREYQLLLLSILIILFLTLCIIVTNLLEVSTTGNDYNAGGINPYFYMNSLAILIILFVFYLILKQWEIHRLRVALSGEERNVKYLEQHMNPNYATSTFKEQADGLVCDSAHSSRLPSLF